MHCAAPRFEADGLYTSVHMAGALCTNKDSYKASVCVCNMVVQDSIHAFRDIAGLRIYL